MSEIKPIDTAPKDGTRIRVFHELDPSRDEVQGEWNGEAWRVSEFFIDPQTNYMYSQPTHWLPITSLMEGERG